MSLFPKRSRVSWLDVLFLFHFLYFLILLVYDSMSVIAFLESGCSILSFMYILYLFFSHVVLWNGGIYYMVVYIMVVTLVICIYKATYILVVTVK